MSDHIQVLTTTAERADADKIAALVVQKRLAACAQVIGPITSTYWWQGKMESAQEWLCLIKSRSDCYQELERVIRQAHPYQVPEILAVPVAAGFAGYLQWVDEQVSRA